MSPSGPDILFAGHRLWTRRPWSRPEMPGAYLLTYTTKGKGQYRLGSTHFTAESGDVVLVHRASSAEHCVFDPKPWDHCYLRFDPWAKWSPTPPFIRVGEGLYRAHVRLLPARQRVEDAFRRLISDVRTRDAARALFGIKRKDAAPPASFDGLRQLALTGLREILLLISEDPVAQGRLDPRIVGALQVLTDDLSGSHDVGSLAKTAGLSTSRFWHLFREQVGVPPQRAIRLLRLQQAALRLVYTTDAVSLIADENGFSSLSDFSRQFRRIYSTSPRAYRERFQSPELPAANPPRAKARSRLL